jgi:hypothetical protein
MIISDKLVRVCDRHVLHELARRFQRVDVSRWNGDGICDSVDILVGSFLDIERI